MGGWSYYGTGVRIYGLELEPPDSVIYTSWLTAFFVPLIPLQRMKCRYLGEVLSAGATSSGLQFERVERLPLSWSSICSTWLWSWAALLATLGPIAFLIWRTDGRAATIAEMVAILALTAALALLPFFVEWRQKMLLVASWRPEKQEAEEQARVAQSAAALTAWQSRHVLSERTFLLAGVVGLVPGVAAGVWFGWGVPLEAAALVSAVLVMGVLFLIDRLLVRIREQPQQQQQLDDWPSPGTSRER